MEKYTVDDKGLLGRSVLETTKTNENSVSRGARSNFSVTSARSRTVRNTGMTTTNNIIRTTSGNGNVIDLIAVVMYQGFMEGFREVPLVNNEGEHITAAFLQKNVALIIGTACNHKTEIQTVLCAVSYTHLTLPTICSV